jgi:hypothetical protein
LTPDAGATAAVKDAPTISLKVTSSLALLTLTISLMDGIWKNTYTFTLLPVELNKVDVVEAKLRDADEAITKLNACVEKLAVSSKPPVLSTSSQTATGQNQIIPWDAETPKLCTESHFALSADFRQVTVSQAGLYQINVRVAGTNNGNGYYLGLQVNGADVAVCFQSEANCHQNTAQIFEILPLKVNDVLQVRSGFNCNSLGEARANRFTIMYLGN